MNRIKKDIYIVFILLALICITIGYAALNSTLNINGKSTINKNTWDVYFDNIFVSIGSVNAVKMATIENNTTVDFEVQLDLPGEFYEFTVDVVNNGTIDAMIESVVKEPDLSEEQQKYLSYIIEYENGEQILKGQLVKSGEFVRVKVTVLYKKDIVSTDLPSENESLSLGFTINYVQDDETGVIVPDNGELKFIDIISGDGTNTSDEVCIGEECFYVMYSDEEKVTMLSKYNLYVGGAVDGSTYAYTEYGDEATGLQHPEMKGALGLDINRKGTIRFSNGKYWRDDNYNLSVEYGTTFPAYVYDSKSTLYNYVESYKTYLETLGTIVEEARLISVEELIALGYDVEGKSYLSAPKWVYSSSYWTGSAQSTNCIYNVIYDDKLDYGIPDQDEVVGLRPVIVISKDYF